MTPNADERLASVIRALTEVVLPHLPPDASLAQEQVHLAVGHLQILRAQLDAIPAFEREELDDALAIGRAVAEVRGDDALLAAIAAADGSDVRTQRKAIYEAIEGVVHKVSQSGDAAAKERLTTAILDHEDKRAQKDRQWFAPFGFDTL